jgi:hypothetical protein
VGRRTRKSLTQARVEPRSGQPSITRAEFVLAGLLETHPGPLIVFILVPAEFVVYSGMSAIAAWSDDRDAQRHPMTVGDTVTTPTGTPAYRKQGR